MEKRTKYALLGLGTVVAIGTGALIYLNYQKNQSKSTSNSIVEALKSETQALPAPSSTRPRRSGTASGFPLKRGSRGELVRNLQNALIKRYGASVLPKFGADGDFGTETATALVAKGLPSVITSELFTKLVLAIGVQSKTTTSPLSTNEALSKELHLSIMQKNLTDSLRVLQSIKDVSQYSAINTIFKKSRVQGLVRKTIVTALLDKFFTASQKKLINAQLYRIGLKYDGSKWALSGLFGLTNDKLVTIESALIWDEKGRSMNVPSATVLGEYLNAQNGVTEFETLDRKRLFVHTNSISYTA